MLCIHYLVICNGSIVLGCQLTTCLTLAIFGTYAQKLVQLTEVDIVLKILGVGELHVNNLPFLLVSELGLR